VSYAMLYDETIVTTDENICAGVFDDGEWVNKLTVTLLKDCHASSFELLSRPDLIC
jgi:hypothetical protein